ncbi:hypothetical protein NEOLEDRAFT_1054809 [Neolentinus lepideus HHB14362 ss-1]|uniref:ASX DEUBAD domain-containing protein n=1 Tax=Neolentinus lepideus HHB14362 ss-1 TaxID=1314782 RepID=A0A165VVX6_9AGAM|nr:hypothetical protein NEOLEDRAFT_1054809 [Neolentinus lepideus HHB14362 ss-1]
MTEETDSARPKRSARAPNRFGEGPSTVATRPSQAQATTSRLTRTIDPVQQLQTLLTSPKSALTQVDITDIFNAGTWDMLPEEARARLCSLLPPTAFAGFVPTIDPMHSSRTQHVFSDSNPQDIEVDTEAPAPAVSLDMLDTSVFTDGHFLAAARTFQDHVYTGWMADTHKEKVKTYETGVQDGVLHAPWKDEVWERDHTSSGNTEQPPAASSQQSEASARAGDAAELKLADLAKNGVIKTGDVLVYKRTFSQLDTIVEKDVIIQSIHPKNYSVTVLIQPGTARELPPELLRVDPPDPDAPTKTMTVTSPNMLENGILDVDGRVERGRRPNGNAWKSLSVWRWRQHPEGDLDMLAFLERGGRENHGTLFYLRGCYYHDR